MDFTKYTERQKDIIEGKVPPYHVMTIEYRRLHAKAMFKFDRDIICFAAKELKRRNARLTERSPYTEKQKSIIEEYKQMEDASKAELATIYHKAQEFGDDETGRKIEAILIEKHGWKPSIEGYNPTQTAIIIGATDIKSVHDNALRGLRKSALVLGDIDVVVYVDQIYRKKGLKMSEAEKDQLEDIEYLIKQSLYGKFKDHELNYARHLVKRLGKHQTVERAIEEEIERRSYHIRQQKYTDHELKIISGDIPVSRARSCTLTNLR